MSPGFMRRRLAFTHNRQPSDKPIGISSVMLDQSIQAVNSCVFLYREECILSVPPDLVVYNFALKHLILLNKQFHRLRTATLKPVMPTFLQLWFHKSNHFLEPSHSHILILANTFVLIKILLCSSYFVLKIQLKQTFEFL